MSSIQENVARIRERIAETALRCGRNPSDIRLMAVTKTVDAKRVLEAVACGVELFGENYVQEAQRKIGEIGKQVEWHMIGRLQTNKARYVIRLFDMVHSVDRLDLAIELDKRARLAGRVLKILVEVRVGNERTKSGVEPENLFALIQEVAALDNLSIEGLMTIPPWFEEPEQVRPFFCRLRELRDIIAEKDIPRVAMKELSMGMTHDFEVAIEEGATIVRIGTAIFGERIY